MTAHSSGSSARGGDLRHSEKASDHRIMAARISVRILVSILATAIGCNQPAGHPDESVAVAAIQKLGGTVEFDHPCANRRVIKVYLHNTTVQDADLAALEKLPKLKNVFLGKTQIGDAGLESLQGASELQTLSLNSTRVTDAGLKSLSGLTNLKTLNLQETQVTAAGTAQLLKSLSGVTIAR